MLNRFIKWAENNSWNIDLNIEKAELPDNIKERYTVPDKWYSFISCIGKCENSTAEKWFLTPSDYQTKEDDEGFRWNEFEIMSLEWTDNDSCVKEYWDKHLPIVMSVEDGYAYYAINTDNGTVVEGCGPEFEEPSVVAESFEAFINKIIAGEIRL